MRPAYSLTIEEGIRNLCLGRSLLKRDIAVGDKLIPVGMTFGADNAYACPGGLLFYNNSLGTYCNATLVQPGESNTPGDIAYSEKVALDWSQMSTKHYDLYSTTEVAHKYTVAAGAYLELDPVPDICQKLRMIEEDFLAIGIEPADNWFPGILVISMGSTRRQATNAYCIDTEGFIIRYADVLVGGKKALDVKHDVELLESLISEDYGLGGTCQWSEVMRPGVMCPTPGRIASQNRLIETSSQSKICWGDIYIQTHRYRIIDKRPHLTKQPEPTP
jgi:hypothetical protein